MTRISPKIKPNIWIFLAALNGFLAVAAAALGAHAIADRVTPDGLGLFRQGADFHLSHALALLGVGVLINMAEGTERRRLEFTGISFQGGIILFSGSLYWLGINGLGSLGPLHLMTPVGGFSLLLGWGILTLTAWKVIWRTEK